MSSPTTTPKRSPKSRRTTPKRNPLQERSPSQKNEAAGRRQKEQEQGNAGIFSTTPFPTKPQHVLLPSTIRKQRSRQNVENELPELFFGGAQPELSNTTSNNHRWREERKGRRAPKIQLKKSVTALRDMYEAQAESSRPSTAVTSRPSTAGPSPALRPMSSRLRSMSSSEGLSGRSAWEMLGLPKVSADDLAMLPTLSEDLPSFDSEHSFASRVRNQGVSSSPNFKTFDASSPNLRTFHDLATSSDPLEASSNLNLQMAVTSSPNVVQLYQDSSMLRTDTTPTSLNLNQGESSPNFVQLQHSSSSMGPTTTPPSFNARRGESSLNIVKLGTSSPRRSSSPTPSQASTTSRKRKRQDVEGSTYAGHTPLFFGARRDRKHALPEHDMYTQSDTSSKYTEPRLLPSSPPELESAQSYLQTTSSPVIRVHGGGFSADRSSIVSAHTNLQSILTSSPGAPTHRPIVRAPDVNQFEIMALHKRQTSGQTRVESGRAPKLSPVPSITNVEVQQLSSTDLDQYQPRRSSSRISVFTEELDDNPDDEPTAPPQAYIVHHDLNSSQVNMISDADRHEAADELSALPKQQSSFAAVLGQARSASFLTSSASSNSLSHLDSLRTSMDERLQVMRSFTHGRNDSFRSSYRPESSSSYRSTTVVPTWARKYYSGFYQNSFQYLYQSSNNLTVPVTHVRPKPRPVSVPASLSHSSSYETISSRPYARHSWAQSLRSSIRDIIPSMVSPILRPRLDVRQSHITAGIGPLVSNPVRPMSEMLSRPPSAYQRQTIRRISMPLSAADPRYHWNGIIEEPESAEEARQLNDHDYTGTPRYSETMDQGQPVPAQASNRRFGHPLRLTRFSTPRLHRDRRLHTGSSASNGYGAPYNTRPQWQPVDGHHDEIGRPAWFSTDIRDSQVICFISGFLFPFMWFVGALLPLPKRPMNYHDLEKRASGYYAAGSHWDETDILARLRLEKHLRGLDEINWQNARWWRYMNRWMCCVGVIILIVVIVLAVIGTQRSWS